MAWYEAHQTLAKHPKTLKLASLLKTDRRYTVGLLHDLFSWGLDAARRDGSLPGVGADEIAAALDYQGKRGKSVVAAIVESGYLELENGTYKIHDWYDYAGKLMDRREADRKRKGKAEVAGKSSGSPAEFQRKSDGISEEIQGTSDGNPYATVPYRTVPFKATAVESARARTCACALEADADSDLSRVMTFFFDKINPTPSQTAIDFLKDFTKNLGADVVLHALGIALDERKTNWRYIQGILQGYTRNGLTTLDAVLRAEQEYAERRGCNGRAGNSASGQGAGEEFHIHYDVIG